MVRLPMTTILGKRTRLREARTFSDSSSEHSEGAVRDLQATFRRHFESEFEPLEQTCRPTGNITEYFIEDAASSPDQSDYDGLSCEEKEIVLVVENRDPQIHNTISTADFRVFIVSGHHVQRYLNQSDFEAQDSKLPSSTLKAAINQPTMKVQQGDGTSGIEENVNIKNDLVLQRLISETRLFENSKDRTATRIRQKVIDLRLRSLGSKSSILEQETMPMSHRKGIIAKACQRDDRRRRKAKDNGVILTTVTWKKKRQGKRVRSVGGPAVGKFKGGTLKLSRKDVAEIRDRD